MATIVAARILRLTISLTISGNRLSLNLHYGANGDIVVGDAEIFLDAWETANLAWLRDALSEEVILEQLYATCVVAETVNPATNILSGQVGSISGEAMPSNIAAVITLRQIEISSKHDGRIYLPGAPEAASVDGLWDDSWFEGAFKDFADALLVPVTPGGGVEWSLVALQRFASSSPVTPVGHTIASVVRRRSPATQRRRTTEKREYHS